MTIAIVGATGNVGRALVEHLGAAGLVPRVLTRNADAAWRAPVDKIVGDQADAGILERLFAGADRAFVMSLIESPEAVDRAVIDAAARAGVRHVVKLSTIGVESESSIGQFHRTREQWIEQSGMAWTFLRPGFFMSNAMQLREQLRAGNELHMPAADGPIVPISPRDIAEVGKVALLEGAAHHGKAYALTGEATITGREQVAVLARVLERPLVCISVPPDVAIEHARKRGLPPMLLTTLHKLWQSTEAGTAAFRTEVFRQVTGHAPETFEDYVRANVDAFR